MKCNEFILNSRKAHKIMRADPGQSALAIEKAKKVLKSRLLCDFASEQDLSFVGHGFLETSEAGLKLVCPNTLAEFAVKRPVSPTGRREAPRREPNYGRSTLAYRVGGEDWSGYDRITFTVFPDCRGYRSVWLELALLCGETETTHRVNLENGKWNTVIWRFDTIERTEVRRFTVSYILQGAQMNMADKAVFCFNNLALEMTEPAAPTPVKIELTAEKCKELVWKTLHYYYSQRCGCDIPTIHLPCHEDCFAKHPDGRLAPIGGGWHNQGFSHSLFATANSASALLRISEKVTEDETLYLRLMEEARVGLEWMLRTRFGDGYRCVDAPIDIYTKGMIGDADDLSFPAHNDAYANFLSAKAEAMAAIAFAPLDSTFAGYAGRCAREDFNFAYERMNLRGKQFDTFAEPPEDLLFTQAAETARVLYGLTKKEDYLSKAIAWEKRSESDGSDTSKSPAQRLQALLGDNSDGISHMVGTGERWITPFSYFGNDIVGAVGKEPSIERSASLLGWIAELL